MNDTPNATRTASRSTTNSSLIESDKVEGTHVFDPSKKHIGTIKRLVIEKVSGRVVYAVAQFGGFLGLGGKEYAIPWDMLTYDTALGGYKTSITEDQLRNAPSFDSDDDYGYDDRDSETELYDYYGVAYYWK